MPLKKLYAANKVQKNRKLHCIVHHEMTTSTGAARSTSAAPCDKWRGVEPLFIAVQAKQSNLIANLKGIIYCMSIVQ